MDIKDWILIGGGILFAAVIGQPRGARAAPDRQHTSADVVTVAAIEPIRRAIQLLDSSKASQRRRYQEAERTQSATWMRPLPDIPAGLIDLGGQCAKLAEGGVTAKTLARGERA